MKFKTFALAVLAVSTLWDRAGHASWDELDKDIIPLVASAKGGNPGAEEQEYILNIKDLGACAQVCKSWRIHWSGDAVWKPRAALLFQFNYVPEEIYLRHVDSFNKSFFSAISGKNRYKIFVRSKNIMKRALDSYCDTLSKDDSAEESTIYRSLVTLERLGSPSLLLICFNNKVKKITMEPANAGNIQENKKAIKGLCQKFLDAGSQAILKVMEKLKKEGLLD